MSLNRKTRPSIGAIATFLAMDRTTLTANLKPLIKRRLAEVAVDPDDKRGRLLALTPAGHALLMSAIPIWERTHRQAEHLLTKSDGGPLRAGLRALS